MDIVSDAEWDQLSPEEKRMQLYLRQVKTLNDFLSGALSAKSSMKNPSVILLIKWEWINTEGLYENDPIQQTGS